MNISDEINGLPKHIRDYIHSLETVSPADMVQENAYLRESLGVLKMNMDDLIEQFVSDLDFDVLVLWADILEVGHDEQYWLDDMWPDCESELRTQVGDAMARVGEKR